MIPGTAKKPTTEPTDLSSRNAVETAIDLAKLDKKSTWEGAALRMRKAIRPWEAIAHAQAHPRPG